jgi:hypothetical protein
MTVRNRKAVTDGDVEKMFAGKLADLKRRVNEGTLPAEYVAEVLQKLTESNFTIGDGLLKFVGVLKLKAVKRFVVADHFKVGNLVGGRSIGRIGPNFQTHFGGVVEENVPARNLYVWELTRDSLDEPIVDSFGGWRAPKTQTCLAHQFQMMELGEKGKSRLDGWANFGYKSSPVDSDLWVPVWDVRDGKFGVGAHSSSYPDAWSAGRRVVGG